MPTYRKCSTIRVSEDQEKERPVSNQRYFKDRSLGVHLSLARLPLRIAKSPGAEAKGRFRLTQSTGRKENEGKEREERQAPRARTGVAMEKEDEGREEETGEEEGSESSPPASKPPGRISLTVILPTVIVREWSQSEESRGD